MLAVRIIPKHIFFDSPAVTRGMDRKTRRVFTRFGAFVRTRAKRSIRKRKRVSEPGSPPSSHIGLLRRLIFFGYDRLRRSVVIGPTLIPTGDGEVPRLLEHGGNVRRPDESGRNVTWNYRARPFMGPAFEAEQSQLPSLWRNSVR